MSLAKKPEVLSLDPQLLHDVIDNIRLVGRATGAEERADEIAEGMESRVEAVAQEMAELPETEHVAITTGSYDVFIWVNLPSSEALASFLHHKAGTVKGVRHTETFVSLDTKKRMAGPGIA